MLLMWVPGIGELAVLIIQILIIGLILRLVLRFFTGARDNTQSALERIEKKLADLEKRIEEKEK